MRTIRQQTSNPAKAVRGFRYETTTTAILDEMASRGRTVRRWFAADRTEVGIWRTPAGRWLAVGHYWSQGCAPIVYPCMAPAS